MMESRGGDLRLTTGLVLGVDETAVHDGPGIRMNVYLKGCPLRCVWCHSPESQSFHPEVVWYETRCARCGQCVTVCPKELRSLDPVLVAKRSSCELCLRCVRQCSRTGLEVKGRLMQAWEIADRASRLLPFFRRTGGGVTLTGGEPTSQPDFSYAVSSLCREQGISMAMETCGEANWAVLRRLSEKIQFFLFDVKLVDEEKHRALTGVSNRRILSNLANLVSEGRDVIARIPLIPGVNDDEETLQGIGTRLKDLGVKRVTLLPYNPATPGKYSWVGRPSPFAAGLRQDPEKVARAREILQAAGLDLCPA